MARALVGRGHEVTVVCGSFGYGAQTGLSSEFRHGKRTGLVEGIRVVEFALPYSNSSSFARRAWVFLVFALRSVVLACTQPCDVVFATSTPLTAAVPGIAARWLRGRRFVFEVRDLWPELPKAMGVINNPLLLRSMRLLELIAYRSCDLGIALAPGIAEGIEASSPNLEVVTIPNGCDLELFANVDPLSKFEKFTATYCGTHGNANGLSALLDAAAELKSRGCSDIRLLLVGDGSEKNKLRERVVSESLGDLVEFVDPVSKAEVASLLKRSHAGLQVLRNVPAFYNGTSPNKFFDYLAAGLPVIINYPGWLAEAVDSSSSGLSISPGDADSLADALELLARDPQLRSEMGVAALGLGLSQFDRSTLATRFVDAIEYSADLSTRHSRRKFRC
jgi:glycosyltransferase involved in cell wall biosynthesis